MNVSDFAIKVENISKCYRIGLKEKVQDSLMGTFLDFLRSPMKNYKKYRSLYNFDDVKGKPIENSGDIIWALRNVSFELKKGKVLGVIGTNGSGKSTLLKVLCRITAPTSGYAKIHGRISSLLEVGTGFHPELTGRENIYLNGTILGMRKKEIDLKFDEIVDFSGVDKFIDTPVKRYSSGMAVRLAFAVAAHLDPEILLVDEVLAVGDAEFQMKCIGKMSNVVKKGRTIIFVSHNMGAISELCDRAIWLDKGILRQDGPSLNVISSYIASGVQGEENKWFPGSSGKKPGRIAYLKYARLHHGNEDNVSSVVHYEEQVKIEIGYEIRKRIRAFKCYLLLKDSSGYILWASHDTDGNYEAGMDREPGLYNSTCVFPERLLRPGVYYVTIGIVGNPRELVEEEYLDAMHFKVSEGGYAFNRDPRKGLFTPFLRWDIVREQI